MIKCPPVALFTRMNLQQQRAGRAARSDWMLAYTYFDLLEPLNGVLRTFMDDAGNGAAGWKTGNGETGVYNLRYLPEDDGW